jgi:hypothetical protein
MKTQQQQGIRLDAAEAPPLQRASPKAATEPSRETFY